MLPNSEKDFIKRHIGPSKEDQSKMLKELNYQTIDDLMNNTVPEKIMFKGELNIGESNSCLLYTSPSPRDGLLSRMPSSA